LFLIFSLLRISAFSSQLAAFFGVTAKGLCSQFRQQSRVHWIFRDVTRQKFFLLAQGLRRRELVAFRNLRQRPS